MSFKKIVDRECIPMRTNPLYSPVKENKNEFRNYWTTSLDLWSLEWLRVSLCSGTSR